MRILVCGASGFIGSAICQRLARDGHQVMHGVRTARTAADVAIDFGRDITPEVWMPRLVGVDAVINAVGIIVETQKGRFDDVHHRAPAALFSACAQAGVTRVVQISALGADGGDTQYFRSKFAADKSLMALPLRWTILRPSLVYGEAGDSSRMFRTLASMPVIPVPSLGAAAFRPVHVDDLVESVSACLRREGVEGQCVDLVGATAVSYRDMINTYRRAMGFGPALYVTIPSPVMAIAAWASGFVPGSPLNPETWRMLKAGSSGDSAGITRLIARSPKGIEDFIAADEAEGLRLRVLNEWRPLVLQISLALVWIVTALLSVFVYPEKDSLGLLARVGLTGFPAWVALYGSALFDLLMGVGTLLYPSRRLWVAQAALVVGYSAIIAFALPEYLIHPFGPVLKNIPILAILFVLFAEDRR